MDVASTRSRPHALESDTTDIEHAPRSVLIVDYDRQSRDLIARILRASGFDCLQAWDACTSTLVLASRRPAAIVLDSLLPGVSGLKYLRTLKQDRRTSDIPVIMTGTSATEQERVTGLDLGADDFIAKPFAQLEFIARLQALLRRCGRKAPAAKSDVSAPLEYGVLRLDPLSHRVSAGRDQFIRLGPSEFRLLRFLLCHPESVHSRQELLEEIRGPNPTIRSRTVDVYMRRLRQALKRHGCDVLLQTVRGCGYKLQAPIGASERSHSATELTRGAGGRSDLITR